MNKEETLGIIKPDAVSRNLIGSIIKLIEDHDITLKKMKMINLSKSQAEDFYSVHKGKIFYDKLIEYMTSGPIIVMVLEGINVVQRYRDLMGKTNPDEAAEGAAGAEEEEDVTVKVVPMTTSLGFEDMPTVMGPPVPTLEDAPKDARSVFVTVGLFKKGLMPSDPLTTQHVES